MALHFHPLPVGQGCEQGGLDANLNTCPDVLFHYADGALEPPGTIWGNWLAVAITSDPALHAEANSIREANREFSDLIVPIPRHLEPAALRPKRDYPATRLANNAATLLTTMPSAAPALTVR